MVTKIANPLHLADNVHIDKKASIASLSRIHDITFPPIGQIFYSLYEATHYKVTSLKVGYLTYSDSSYTHILPQGVELVDWEEVPNLYIGNYTVFGSGEVVPDAGDMLKSVYDTNNSGRVDNADKVNGKTVLSNVPANAKFTDTNTITTINNKTGAITKDDILALGISEGGNNGVSQTYVDNKVKTPVPLNALFTDTNTTYTAGKNVMISPTNVISSAGGTEGGNSEISMFVGYHNLVNYYGKL